jgi:hypothetical protein
LSEFEGGSAVKSRLCITTICHCPAFFAQDPHRNVSEPAYMTILDIVLDAKCDKNCKQGSFVLR